MRVAGKFEHFQVLLTDLKADNLKQRIASDFISMPRIGGSFDLIHFPTYPPIADRYNSKLMIYHLHDLTWWRFPSTASRLGKTYYKRLATKYLEGSDVITTGTETIKNELEDFFGIQNDRVKVIPPGVKICNCIPNSYIPKRPYLLYVGTIEPRKNLKLLIDAYKNSGAWRWIDLKLAGRFGWGVDLPVGVDALGAVTDEQLHSLYSNCYAVIQPSIYEGFGLPLIEAAIHEKPVICSDLEVFREVLGGNAIYLNPYNVNEWMELINQIQNITMKIASKEEIRTKYNWENSSKITLNLYEELLDKS